MNYPKYLINSFAILGVISLIVFACASTDIDSDVPDDTNPPIVTTGKYQISSSASATTNGLNHYMDVVDTETGVVKHYQFNNNSSTFVLITTTITQ